MDPALVLVPGAGGDAWYWHRLVPELTRRGLTAVAVDLPADDDSAGLDAYVETVLAAASPWQDVVVVAQSMGGFIGPLVCARRPVRARGIRGCATPSNAPSTSCAATGPSPPASTSATTSTAAPSTSPQSAYAPRPRHLIYETRPGRALAADETKE
jgi:pimeloyl-ACP methyl ester carboxylesterase